MQIAHSRVRKKRTPTPINCMTFYQGLWPYSELHSAYLSSISRRYKWGYTYFFLPNFPGATFFQGGTFNRDSRVEGKMHR